MLTFDLWEKIPRLNGDVNYLELSRTLSEPEVLILSRVNGRLPLGEIVSSLRYERDYLARIVARLTRLHALLFDDPRIAEEITAEIVDFRGDFARSETRASRPRGVREPTAPDPQEAPAAAWEPEWEAPAGEPSTEPAPAPASEPAPAASERFAESGNWDVDSFFALINRLYVERRTGLLRVFRDRRTYKTFYLERGRIVNIASMPFSVAECLGRVIQRAGLIDQAKVIDSLLAAKRTGQRQGEELVAMGAIDGEILFEMLRVQMEVKATEIMDWALGDWSFEEAASLPASLSRIDVSMPRLLFSLAWKRYPHGRVPMELKSRQNLYIGKRVPPTYTLDDFHFDDAMKKFCGIALERDNTVKRLFLVTNLKAEKTYKVTWILHLLGILDFFDEPLEKRNARRIAELSNRLRELEHGSPFDGLGVAWTADSKMVQNTYVRAAAEMDHAIENSDGPERRFAEQIREHLDRVYETIKTREGRRISREKFLEAPAIAAGAEARRRAGEEFLFGDENPKAAIPEFEAAIEVIDNHGEYLAELGLARFQVEYAANGPGVEDARRLIRRGIAASPESDVVRLCEALMYKEEYELAKALASLARARQLNPNNRLAGLLIEEINAGRRSAAHENAVRDFLDRDATPARKTGGAARGKRPADGSPS